MRAQVLDTSIDAYHGIGNAYKATGCESIYSIVAHTPAPLSLREIQFIYRKLEGVDIDVSTVSARVNELITAGRLERTAPVRKCKFSGKTIHPVSIVPVQLRLV